MKRRRLSTWLVLSVAIVCGLPARVLAASTAELLVQIPIPFNARLQSVGREVQHNGQLMSLATFNSSSTLEETADFYRELWSQEQVDGRPGMVENRIGQWLVIGQLQNDHQSVLQLDVSNPHQSDGFLSVMKLAQGNAAAVTQALLPGMARLSTTRSQDAGRVSQLSVFSSQEAVEPLSRQLAAYWQDQGWTLVSNEDWSQSRVLLLNHQSAQLEIVVSQASGIGTLVVMNEIDDHD